MDSFHHGRMYIVNGHVFSSQDPDQLDLLREFMKLQKEMMIMLLSMLEGIFHSRS